MTRDRILLAALLVALAAIGTAALAGAVRDLRAARGARAMLAAAVASPVPPARPTLPPDRTVPSPAAAAAIVRAAAMRAGLLVEVLAPLPADPPLIRLRLVASGGGGAVLRLAESVEGGTPLLRFSQWRVARTAGGALRLTAIVAAIGR